MADEKKEAIEQKTAAMYEDVELMQNYFGEIEVEGFSDNNLVKIILTGQHEIKEISIDPALPKESNKDLEDYVMAAYQDAKIKMEEQVKILMAEVVKEVGL